MLEFVENSTTNIAPNKGSAYYSIIKIGENIHIYSRRRRDYSNTMHLVSADGIKFKVCEPVLNESYACHNFSVHFGRDASIEAIGGQIHTGHMPHNDGLYHFLSQDGFTFVESSRLIGACHPNYINGILWGLEAELDGHHCSLYDSTEERQYLFLRANIAAGVRGIQIACRSGLAPYGDFQLLKINGKIAENYYSSNFFKIERTIFGLLPFVDQTKSALQLIASRDYESWYYCADFFEKRPWTNNEGNPKNTDHPVQGIVDRGTHLDIYVHHNYLGHDPSIPVNIQRYRFRKSEFLELASKAILGLTHPNENSL